MLAWIACRRCSVCTSSCIQSIMLGLHVLVCIASPRKQRTHLGQTCLPCCSVQTRRHPDPRAPSDSRIGLRQPTRKPAVPTAFRCRARPAAGPSPWAWSRTSPAARSMHAVFACSLRLLPSPALRLLPEIPPSPWAAVSRTALPLRVPIENCFLSESRLRAPCCSWQTRTGGQRPVGGGAPGPPARPSIWRRRCRVPAARHNPQHGRASSTAEPVARQSPQHGSASSTAESVVLRTPHHKARGRGNGRSRRLPARCSPACCLLHPAPHRHLGALMQSLQSRQSPGALPLPGCNLCNCRRLPWCNLCHR
jgi:hypothetical protein